ILGKILGESLVALPQALGILAFGFILQIPLSGEQLIRIVLATGVVALFGGAFGVIVLANLGSQRAANQIFPFVMLPQFFLAAIFSRSVLRSGRRSPAPRPHPRKRSPGRRRADR